MRIVKRTLKWLAISYVCLLVFVVAHIPQTTSMLLRSGRPGIGILITPILTPMILTAYGQAVFTAGWPFRQNPDAVDLDELIAERGSDWPSSERRDVKFDMSPELKPGREGRLTRTLESERYAEGINGAFVEGRFGWVLKFGRAICLSPRKLTALRSRCFLLFSGGGNRYFWKELGESELRESGLIPPYSYKPAEGR